MHIRVLRKSVQRLFCYNCALIYQYSHRYMCHHKNRYKLYDRTLSKSDFLLLCRSREEVCQQNLQCILHRSFYTKIPYVPSLCKWGQLYVLQSRGLLYQQSLLCKYLHIRKCKQKIPLLYKLVQRFLQYGYVREEEPKPFHKLYKFAVRYKLLQCPVCVL